MKVINNFSSFFLLAVLLLAASSCNRQKTKDLKQENGKVNVFEVKNPDYQLSPATGMTRTHWVNAAEYILNGAFSYINTLDDPMKFPKQAGKTYPHNDKQVPTEKLEGLCRTLFVAAPLLKENPDLTLNGIGVADYYRHQILNLINPESPSFIVPRPKNGGPSQNLVEFGALAISLFVAPEVIWEPLTQNQKDDLAHTMLSYGDGPTVPSNWRFFNIFILSFFKDQGYKVNEELLLDYLNKSIEKYKGYGWYNDSPAYDYYSMWAFQLYSVLWSDVFGLKNYPALAEKLIAHFQDLNYNYPNMFSKEGEMLMYGRSISYRFGSIAPFPFMGKYGGDAANLGWLRKISSRTILQFLQHPEFLKDSVPTLGFYGPYEPAVQNYSCRGSVYWMGKAFLGLLLPKDDRFWTAIENDGPWETYSTDSVYNKFAKGSNVLMTNYPILGASEIRAWCHEKVKDDWQKFRSTENYNRLSYSSIFPWQADGENGEIAMNYGLKNAKGQWEVFRLYSFKKFEDGCYYRDAVLETDENIKMNLVDIPITNGILRVDRNVSTKRVEMRLGHYALPEFDTEIKVSTRQVGVYQATIIDNGTYQLAMVPLLGWEYVVVLNTKNLHPVSDKSAVIEAIGGSEYREIPQIYATLMLWKKSGEAWSDDELCPVKSFEVSDKAQQVKVHLNDLGMKSIRFQ
ncbi:DUF2264 domain-containing protein [Saccharicrinis fermentans]|uniref:DUF2264 domain-containing protein n=1 Tax=Saccharicrinis fermentans DSM 9555 = JCM 21142 TaxID=869213 RepID=W7Y5J8_9BACT|nr:DUF2264 domain-containing protein [Saccharicrinis fermentans]GAF02843.1 hypothetical protein JCM21142_41488 [Saccharicrinis fermentans DSM 9555 = JCM 21142]